MNFEDLKNPELQEKLRACETTEELVKLAQVEGVELSDEQLESISGSEWTMSTSLNKHCRSVHK